MIARRKYIFVTAEPYLILPDNKKRMTRPSTRAIGNNSVLRPYFEREIKLEIKKKEKIIIIIPVTRR